MNLMAAFSPPRRSPGPRSRAAWHWDGAAGIGRRRATSYRAVLRTMMLAVLVCWGPTVAEGADAEIDFTRQIQPLLARRCYACHGPDKSEGGLQLHEAQAALAELDSGARAIVPGDVETSELLTRVSAEDESVRMPPEGDPLKPEEIGLLRQWIAAGAEWERHWSFRPLTSPEVPQVRDTAWPLQPIDNFILHQLEQRGLTPAPPADRRTLIRRLYFDLIGLPPTPERVEEFVHDERPDAYERLVDELLESPHYGERWGRHWLDLVRFAETNSFERDGAKPNAWKYRDYVVKSLNDDKPYDQFVREQLAGDELDHVTTETLTATGFYRLGIWDDEPADPLQAQYDELDNVVATIGQVFLGLTVNCARCHDHKIDPIPQRDYYGLLAFLADVTTYGTRADQTSMNQIDITPPEVREAYRQLDRRQEALREQMQVIEQAGISKMSATDQRRTEGDERERVLRQKLKDHLDEDQWAEYRRLRDEMNELRERRRELPEREAVLGLARYEDTPRTTHVLLRGSPQAPGDEVQPTYPSLFEQSPPEVPSQVSPRESAGRRRVLADWITSPENRLTARVIANRLWQFHVGRGIVRSSNNFGKLGTPPTHPELLDWLAQRLIAEGWRLKPIHRQIVLSQTYRMSSAANERGLEIDPANDLFWRFDMRRLSGEELRDTILAVTGQLNPEVGGPSFYEAIPDEVLATQSQPGLGWGNSSERERGRRSIYIHVKRSLITPLLSTFDFPDTDTSCEARFVTVQPGQALTLLNGAFLHEQAGRFAERVRREAGDDTRSQVARALELALTRPASGEEVDEGVALIKRLTDRHGITAGEALRFYCLTVLNLNEFVYLD